MTGIDTDKPEFQRSRIRPTSAIKAAIRQAALSGMEVELRPDGTLIARPATTGKPAKNLAKKVEIVL